MSAPMSPKTLAALKASIAKWERNAVAETPDEYLTSDKDCPLCHLFFHENCSRCPVSDRTGETLCKGTPYVSAVLAVNRWWCGEGYATGARAAAREEVAFLRSLLPESDDA